MSLIGALIVGLESGPIDEVSLYWLLSKLMVVSHVIEESITL